MVINAVCWFTLLAFVVMVLATILMAVVDPLFGVIATNAMGCFVAGNLTIAHHNHQAQTA